MSACRADRLTEPVVQLLADMGCFRLWNGSESGSQRVLDAMGARSRSLTCAAKTHLLQKYGIEAGMFIMLGYEGETVADIADGRPSQGGQSRHLPDDRGLPDQGHAVLRESRGAHPERQAVGRAQ
ncbi:MAG: hypothetical protein IPM16_15005 [Chloroflexi bacterium]|nr:hypothetical protein [Chloroflexota bacterium]